MANKEDLTLNEAGDEDLGQLIGFSSTPNNESDSHVIDGDHVVDLNNPDKDKDDVVEEEVVEEKKDDEVPAEFHTHPAWQRIIKERDSSRDELMKEREARVAAETESRILREVRSTQAQAAVKENEPQIPFKDITKLSEEEIAQWQTDDPKGYAANLYAQILHEVTETVSRKSVELEQVKSVEKTFKEYSDANPSFMTMWKSGELKKFMDDHPGHNAISAHMALTSEAKVKEAVDKAVKEATEKVEKEARAKRRAGVVNKGNVSRPSDATYDEKLKNPKKYGGVISVLLGNLMARRNSPST